MNGTQLKVFHAVAQAGSFSRAALELGLTQPAVSDHIRKLETAHGVRLFERGPKGASPTLIGRKLLAIAERHAEAESEARDLLTSASALMEGELTVGADAAVHVLSAIKNFSGKFPGIAIRLVSGNSLMLMELLHDHAIDFAVVASVQQRQGLEIVELRSDPLVAIVSSKSHLAKRKSIAAEVFSQTTTIMREAGSATRELAFNMFAKADITLHATISVE